MSGFPPWDTVTDGAKDFVKCLIKANPADRLTSEKLLDHPWLIARCRHAGGANEHDMRTVVQNLRIFSEKCAFSRMLITAVARQLDHTSLRSIHQVFKCMDTNCDGV